MPSLLVLKSHRLLSVLGLRWRTGKILVSLRRAGTEFWIHQSRGVLWYLAWETESTK